MIPNDTPTPQPGEADTAPSLVNPPRRKPGPPRIYVDHAAKCRAYRQRQADGVSPTRRLDLTISIEAHAAVMEAATREGVKPSTVVDRLIKSALLGEAPSE